MEQGVEIDVMVADASHEVYVDIVLETIEAAAKVRGTGIAKRTHEYVAQKMKEGKAIIALAGDEFAGFTYIESWGNKQYVATSGLIVVEKFRGLGLAKRIKDASFALARFRRYRTSHRRNACIPLGTGRPSGSDALQYVRWRSRPCTWKRSSAHIR